MEKKYYGTTADGRVITEYIIRNSSGMEASFLDFGATWISMFVPDRDGIMRDVVLSHDSLSGYEVNYDMFGAFIGRVAGRTEGAAFTLDGQTYPLENNENGNNLHSSSTEAFHKALWTVENSADNSVTFYYHSGDGDCGFPGNLDVRLTYSLTDAGELVIKARYICDRRTITNMTQHAYFNLSGMGSGDCLDTMLTVNAEKYLPLREGSIPTGEIASVADTPFDFRTAKPIGRDFFAADPQQTLVGGGYDHYFVTGSGQLHKAAEAYSPKSGICMETFHNQQGLQLYTGNWIHKCLGRGGVTVDKYHGFCMECHGFPNAVNTPGFPSPVIEAGQEYETTIIYRFSCR